MRIKFPKGFRHRKYGEIFKPGEEAEAYVDHEFESFEFPKGKPMVKRIRSAVFAYSQVLKMNTLIAFTDDRRLPYVMA